MGRVQCVRTDGETLKLITISMASRWGGAMSVSGICSTMIISVQVHPFCQRASTRGRVWTVECGVCQVEGQQRWKQVPIPNNTMAGIIISAYQACDIYHSSREGKRSVAIPTR